MRIRIRKARHLAAALQRFADLREKRIVKRATEKRAAINPTCIGVTGSSGKSTTTALLGHILAGVGKVRGNSDANTYGTLIRTLSRMPRDTRFVAAECGVGRIGHMEPMARMLQPDVAIVTLVALEHKSEFRTREAIAAEKGLLVEALRPDGLAILNADDPLVRAMGDRTSARVVTFGLEANATYRAINVRVGLPERLSFTVTSPKGEVNLRSKFVGEHFWLPVLAAATAALELGVPTDVVADRVASFEPLVAAGGTIAITGGPLFVLDTTKAPWHSVPLAFDMVRRATAPRRRIVLGHMSDFAGSDQKYRDAYRLARAAADEVIFVGSHSHRSRASDEDHATGRFHAFATPLEVIDHLRATAVPGEVILLKGSVDLHLERLALAFREDVRCWVVSCGKKQGCLACRRYREPYEWHKGEKKRTPLGRGLRKLLRGPDKTPTRARPSATIPATDGTR